MAAGQSFGCFILVLKSGEQVLVANHEDWFAKDAAVRVIPKHANRYGSIVFTFLSEGWAQGGMNEHGLFFDAAYTPFQELEFAANRKEFSGYIWQAMLDRCRNVAEALAFLAEFQLPDLEESHIVIADATGNAFTLGVNHGELATREIAGRYLLQTNFNPWQPELSDEQSCWRTEAALKIMGTERHKGEQLALEVLKSTHQDSLTVYSNIYDLRNRTITVFNRRHFDRPIRIDFNEFAQMGDCVIALDELEKSGRVARCQEGGTEYFFLRGRVVNSEDGSAIPYTNIGLLDRELGTLSDEDGTFELTVPLSFAGDSIRFSSIGYRNQSFLLRPRPSGEMLVQLKPEARVLDEVKIERPRRVKVARLGWMGGRDGVLPMDTLQGGGAVAMLVEAPAAPVFVEKLQVRLMYNSKDTLRLRLHFYSVDTTTGLPSNELLQKEVILSETKRYGWLRYDLSNYEITIPSKKFFVGFEWIDERETRSRMISGLKDWEVWKKMQYEQGNDKVELLTDRRDGEVSYKYHGNMMNWPGFDQLPPFTGLMVETGKHAKTRGYRTFERKTSFAPWRELNSTLNAVVVVVY